MTNRKLLAVGALWAAAGLGACDMGDLTSVNDNPNDPTTAPAPSVFTYATRIAVDRWLGDDNDLRGWELVAQHLAEVQYPESDQYKRLTSSFTTTAFDAAYYTEVEDFEQVIQAGREAEAPGYWAPAAVMQSWVFGNLTDVWGDVPYSSALQGDSVGAENAFQPAYDPQEEIYHGIFDQLEAAASALAGASGGPSLGGADPIYGGDFLSWQRFANSLHARYALRIVNVDPATASAELQAAFNGPGGTFQSNADNAVFPWPGDGVYDNPWATNFKTRDDHRISNRFMTFLGGWNDPRLPVFAMPTAADPTVYAGLPNALSHSEASTYSATTSRPGAIFYPGATSYGNFGGAGTSQPSYVMTYAEVAFIKAEAAERGLGGLGAAQARDFYEAGIRASMEQWGVTDQARIDAYLSQPEVAYKGGVEGLKQIAIQKWIALYTDGIQAWSEFRRTCQPAILRPGPEAITDRIPGRYEYSTTEAAVNSASLAEAVARQGPDELVTPVWWGSATTSAPTYEAGCGER